MKLNLNIVTFLFILLFAGSASAINPISPEAHASAAFSVDDFLDMNYKEYKAMTGTKWVLGDRLKHKVLKKYIQVEVRRNKIETNEDFAQAASGFSFKWGAFFLGFFLNILGLILVLLFYGRPRKDAMISWLIGFLLGGIGIGYFLR